MKQLRGGFSLLELDVVDSTNEYLKRQGGQLPDKTVVMAHRQTAGKGRLGGSWQSEPGCLSNGPTTWLAGRRTAASKSWRASCAKAAVGSAPLRCAASG